MFYRHANIQRIYIYIVSIIVPNIQCPIEKNPSPSDMPQIEFLAKETTIQ
jgi:hypothetical protein